MKNLSQIYSNLAIGLGGALLLSGCFAQDDFDLEADSNPPIVIQAVITDQAGPYYVQVSRAISRTIFPADDNINITFSSIHDPVTNATVTLTDDQGNSDVLAPYDQAFPIPNAQGDTLPFAAYGFYRTTTSLRGVPGSTYTLTVQHEGKTYEAKATMPQAPPAIRIDYDQLIYPLLSFSEPQGTDFYRFFYRRFSGNDLTTSRFFYNQVEDNLWPLLYPKSQTYSDQFWGNEVENLDIYRVNFPQGTPQEEICGVCPDNIQIQMHTMTEEAYEFYNALNRQIRTDGGTFNPEPATPPTNFSNGALGFFTVSTVRSIIAPIRY